MHVKLHCLFSFLHHAPSINVIHHVATLQKCLLQIADLGSVVNYILFLYYNEALGQEPIMTTNQWVNCCKLTSAFSPPQETMWYPRRPPVV